MMGVRSLDAVEARLPPAMMEGWGMREVSCESSPSTKKDSFGGDLSWCIIAEPEGSALTSLACPAIATVSGWRPAFRNQTFS